jgi:hypothetical protein
MRDVEMGDKKRKRIPGLKPHVEKVKETERKAWALETGAKKNMVHIQLLTFADSRSPRHNVISS